MASCFFLLRQFDDVLIYLNSIRVITVTYVNILLSYFDCKYVICIILDANTQPPTVRYILFIVPSVHIHCE